MGGATIRGEIKPIVELGIFSGSILIILGFLLLLLPWAIEKLGTRNPKLLENAAKFPYVILMTGVMVVLLSMLYLFTTHIVLIWRNCL